MKNHTLSSYIFQNDSRILLALSGGPDSVACFHWLHQTYPQLFRAALYVNHKLRSEAENEVSFCKDLCVSYEVKFIHASADVALKAKQEGLSVEEAGRLIRYDLLVKEAIANNCNIIVTAHNEDDVCESIIMSLFSSGDSLRGGIYKNFTINTNPLVFCIRPFLEVKKQEILAWLTRNQFKYCTDISNDSLDYVRNKIRHQLIPMIKNTLNPNINRALIRFQKEKLQLADLVDQVTSQAVKEGQNNDSFSFKVFNAQPPIIKKQLIRQILNSQLGDHHELSDNLIQNIQKFLEKKKNDKIFRLTSEIGIAKTIKSFTVLKLNQKRTDSCALHIGANQFNRTMINLSLESKKIKDSKYRVTLDADKIEIDSLYVRFRQNGDRFCPLGLNGSKTLGDFFIDRKISFTVRDEISLICDNQQIIWVVGVEISNAVKTTNETRNYLVIEVIDN